jgi:hypothetical protein
VVERRIKQARFSATKSLDTFDFTAIPSLKGVVLAVARVRKAMLLRTARLGAEKGVR